MRKIKKVLILLLSVVLLLSFSKNSSAMLFDTIQDDDYELLWNENNDIDLFMTKSNNILTMSLFISNENFASVKGVLYLEKYDNYDWQFVDSWTFNSHDFINLARRFSGQVGSTYRARVTVNIGGENFTTTSNYVSL